MPDPLKFLNDLEAKVVNPPRDRTRRTLDAIDELRTDNSRLKRENEDLRGENSRLKEQLAQVRTVAAPIGQSVQSQVPVVQPVVEEREEDDAKLRFSLLELK